MPAQLTISEHTSPAPNRRPCRLNACTLTPAIGASTTLVGISTGPIDQLSRRSAATRDMVRTAARKERRRVLTGIPRASYDSRPCVARFATRFPFPRVCFGGSVKDVILTPEGYENLKQELDHLRTDRRRDIAERIRVAREFGDIAENAEYDDAKNEQAMLEHKIAQLEERLLHARVIDTGEVDTSVVSVGSVVRLRDVDAKETVEYYIVGSAEANPAERKLSNESPVGKAIIGHKKGETVEVVTPRGSKIKFKIMEIKAA
jgi:transcription elongation factor GreA